MPAALPPAPPQAQPTAATFSRAWPGPRAAAQPRPAVRPPVGRASARPGAELRLLPIDRPAGAPAPPAEPADQSPVCGWLESSLDLRQGLQVQEHEQPDALQAWLPWHWWLRWALDEPVPSIR